MAWISADFKSKVLNMPVEAEILVPQPGYKRLRQKEDYKVMILLHGANNDRTEWLLKSQIYDLVKELPILVFMPSGKNSFYVNTANGYRYMDFITEEIPEFIRKNFRVSTERKDWLIAGESMGGYGALVCGLNHPEVFGSIGAFSGALDIVSSDTHLPVINMELVFGEDWEKTADSSYNLFRQCHRVEDEMKPRIFMNCGKQDRLYDMNVRFYEEIRNEYDVTYTDGDGNHNFTYWNERLKELIPWFMGSNQEEEVLA